MHVFWTVSSCTFNHYWCLMSLNVTQMINDNVIDEIITLSR